MRYNLTLNSNLSSCKISHLVIENTADGIFNKKIQNLRLENCHYAKVLEYNHNRKVIFIECPIVNKVIDCTLKTSNFLNSIVIIHHLLNAGRLYTFNFISLMRAANDFFLYAKIYLLPSKL